MKNYAEYKSIKAKAKAKAKKRIASNKKEIFTNWENFKNTWIYREYLTQRQKQKTQTEQKKIIFEKLKKEEDKRLEDFLSKCDQIAKAETLTHITIKIEWVRSKTWGFNPHAELWTNDGYYVGSASGCGYDKRSAATAEALNKSLSCLKLIYNAYEKALRKDKNISLRDAVGYGSGYDTPYFEGGVGYSCHDSIFRKLGAKTHTWQEGKTWDYMEYSF